MSKDYYKILGVGINTSSIDIKKAYRRLAKEWHPDVNKSPEAEIKFKEIQEAYDILSKPRKRNPSDIFGKPFPSDIFGHMFGTVYRSIHFTVEIDYLDMILGCKKIIVVEGEQVEINIPKCSQNGSAIRILPNKNNEYIIVIKVKLPKTLTEKQEKLLKKIKYGE